MAKEAKKPNYTPELTEKVKNDYAAGVTIEAIAEATGKTVKSIRAKLVREGVYVAAEKPVKTAKDEGPTKKELLAELSATGFDVAGFEGATKEAIKRVISLVVA